MPVVLFVDDLGAVHHAPAPAAYRVGDLQQVHAIKGWYKHDAEENQAEPGGSSWNKGISNQASSGTQNTNPPSPITTNIQPLFPACPGRTFVNMTEGLLAVPDAALSIIMQHLDKQSQLQLSYSCKAMTTAVFTRQQNQATLVIKDHKVKWCALLKVLSWLPVTAWRLGYKDVSCGQPYQAPSYNENLLDNILGWQDCFQGRDYAAKNMPVTSKALLKQWNSYCPVDEKQWRTPLEYPSVANVSLQGMRLAFLVPSALTIACPNMLQLTLVACKVGMLGPSECGASTICSSLTALHLKSTCVFEPCRELAPDNVRRCLPNLRKLILEGSTRAEALVSALVGQLEILEKDTLDTVPFKDLTPKVLAGLPKLHTLSLRCHNMTGLQFTMLAHMLALRKLAVFGFTFEHNEDYHKQHTHLTSLHMCGSTLELTTLGRLPLHSLKNDPISRQCLKVILPYPDSIAETARAIRNLKGCCSFPISVGSLILETHRNDNYKEEVHAAMLLDTLTTFKVDSRLALTRTVLGNSFLGFVGRLHISGIDALDFEGCQLEGDNHQLWRELLQHLPKMKQITLRKSFASQWADQDVVILIARICKAWAIAQHKQPLSVILAPSCPDLKYVGNVVRVNSPPKVSLRLYSDSIRCLNSSPIATAVPDEGDDNPLVPAVVAVIQ